MDKEELKKSVRFLVAPAVAKYTPTKVLREENRQYWEDISKLESAIMELFDTYTEEVKREGFEMGFKAAGGDVFPLDVSTPKEKRHEYA